MPIKASTFSETQIAFVWEVRFETPPGVQAQVDFARFVVEFADDPGTSRIDNDPACGRGWVIIGTAGRLVGHFFIHNANNSGFVCEPD